MVPKFCSLVCANLACASKTCRECGYVSKRMKIWSHLAAGEIRDVRGRNSSRIFLVVAVSLRDHTRDDPNGLIFKNSFSNRKETLATRKMPFLALQRLEKESCCVIMVIRTWCLDILRWQKTYFRSKIRFLSVSMNLESFYHKDFIRPRTQPFGSISCCNCRGYRVKSQNLRS